MARLYLYLPLLIFQILAQPQIDFNDDTPLKPFRPPNPNFNPRVPPVRTTTQSNSIPPAIQIDEVINQETSQQTTTVKTKLTTQDTNVENPTTTLQTTSNSKDSQISPDTKGMTQETLQETTAEMISVKKQGESGFPFDIEEAIEAAEAAIKAAEKIENEEEKELENGDDASIENVDDDDQIEINSKNTETKETPLSMILDNEATDFPIFTQAPDDSNELNLESASDNNETLNPDSITEETTSVSKLAEDEIKSQQTPAANTDSPINLEETTIAAPQPDLVELETTTNTQKTTTSTTGSSQNLDSTTTTVNNQIDSTNNSTTEELLVDETTTLVSDLNETTVASNVTVDENYYNSNNTNREFEQTTTQENVSVGTNKTTSVEEDPTNNHSSSEKFSHLRVTSV